MSASVSRAERAFDRVTARVGVTECGQQWLKAALDPFHDKVEKIEGFPDLNNSLSVVQVVPITATISRPSGISSSTNWACHILNMPWLNPVDMAGIATTAGNTYTLDGSTALQAFGGVSCLSCPDDNSSTQWSMLSYPTGSTDHTVTNLSIPSTYLVGKNRIIGSGVEVYNTTAEINLQGSVTCYRTPVPDYSVPSTYNLYSASPGTTIANLSGFNSAESVARMPAWPVNNNNALLLKGSRSWKAADGSYQTHALHSLDIPCDNSDYIMPFVVDSNSVAYAPNTNGGAQYNVLINSGGGPWNILSGRARPQIEWTKFDQSGAIYTGLSPGTTLFVRWNVYIERFPDSSLQDLVVLATPSPEYDPRALEVYSVAINDMPMGVPVAENGIGDWFGGIVGKIGEVVGGISNRIADVAEAIPIPIVQKIGAGARLVGSVATGVANSRSGGGAVAPAGNVYIDKPLPPPARIPRSISRATAASESRRMAGAVQRSITGVNKPGFLKRGGGRLASAARKK